MCVTNRPKNREVSLWDELVCTGALVGPYLTRPGPPWARVLAILLASVVLLVGCVTSSTGSSAALGDHLPLPKVFSMTRTVSAAVPRTVPARTPFLRMG